MLKKLFSLLGGLFGASAGDRARGSDLAKKYSVQNYVAQVADEPPEKVAPGILYLIEDGQGSYWLGIIQCPCGCGAAIELPMTPATYPCWLFNGSMMQPSLSPSVRRTSGCKSHFVLRGGSVAWSDDS